MNITFQSDMWRRCRWVEGCTSVYQRGNWYVGTGWEELVLKHRPAQPRHMSAGRFEERGTGLCYMPWYVLEPEEGDLIERRERVLMMIDLFEAHGMAPGCWQVRFSGNQSFWLCIPAGVMGNPVGSWDSLKALAQRTFLGIAECTLDENLWDPRHLMRMPGSVHEKGGRVKWWGVEAFRRLPLSSLLQASDSVMLSPHNYPIDEQLYARAVSKTIFHAPPMEGVPRDLKGSLMMRETEDGVSEGDRNYTAFCRACGELRQHTEAGAWQALQDWNARNDPPLSDKELGQCFASAQRTIKRAA